MRIWGYSGVYKNTINQNGTILGYFIECLPNSLKMLSILFSLGLFKKFFICLREEKTNEEWMSFFDELMRGGEGGWYIPMLQDVLCEQPLSRKVKQ
jgi:hypothetical protein